MSRRPRRASLASHALAALVALALAGLAACGPVRYVSDVTHNATDAVEAARAVHADKYAPYWWTRATQYLHKAHEVAAHADFQAASRFGRIATEAATRAAEEATLAARDASRRPLDLPPDVAPAKERNERNPAPVPVAPAKDSP
ncbi:MAG TPA: hypothetical protein VLM79_40690 [Kofleriaceae bacterium]|nr:hypothetical protein [Kofleriaceae bacterium]